MKLEIELNESLGQQLKYLQKTKCRDMTLEELAVELIDDCVVVWQEDDELKYLKRNE